jgi:dUTP pyrophosphatase
MFGIVKNVSNWLKQKAEKRSMSGIHEVVIKVMVPEDHPIPKYQHKWDAGFDLRSLEDLVIMPGEHESFQAGLRIEIPEGYVGLVCPRSGLARKYGVTLLNTPGVVDAPYRGVVGVNLINHGKQPFTVMAGDRVAQMLIVPVAAVQFMRVDSLTETSRGEGGFGSTGCK